jgi:hypothetical protein
MEQQPVRKTLLFFEVSPTEGYRSLSVVVEELSGGEQ